MSNAALSWAMRQRVGNQPAKHVLMLLADYADERGSCFPPQEMIAEIAEMSARTVQNCILRLEELGLLMRERSRRSDGTLGLTRYRLAVGGRGTSPQGEGSALGRRDGDSGAGGEKDSTAEGVATEGAAPPEARSGGPPESGDGPPESDDTATGKRFRSNPPEENPPEDEREGARARGAEQAAIAEAEAGFGRLVKAYGPVAAIADHERCRQLWYPLDAAAREAAIAAVPDFHAVHKAAGRTARKGLEAYLRDRSWEALAPAAAPKGGEPAAEMAQQFSQRWWALWWARWAAGNEAGLRDMARKAAQRLPARAEAAELPNEAEVAALARIEARGAEALAWQRLVAGRWKPPLWMPLPDAAPYLWAPQRAPPEARQAELAEDAAW